MKYYSIMKIKLTEFLYIIMVEWPMHNNVYQDKSGNLCSMNLLIQNLKTKAKYQRKCNSYIQGILFNSKKEKQFHATRWIQVKLLYSIKKKNPSTKDQILFASYTNYILVKAKILGWKSARDCRKEERINLKRPRCNFVWGWKCPICSFFILGM